MSLMVCGIEDRVLTDDGQIKYVFFFDVDKPAAKRQLEIALIGQLAPIHLMKTKKGFHIINLNLHTLEQKIVFFRICRALFKKDTDYILNKVNTLRIVGTDLEYAGQYGEPNTDPISSFHYEAYLNKIPPLKRARKPNLIKTHGMLNRYPKLVI